MSNLSRSQREALQNRQSFQREKQHISNTQQQIDAYWKEQNQRQQDAQDRLKNQWSR